MENFDELLESELNLIEEEYDDVLLDFIEDAYEGDLESLSEDLEITLEEATELYEQLVKRVSSRGAVTKTKTRSVRSRRATRTTGMSRAKLKRRARLAARTRRKSPGSIKKAVRKRNKALRRRKQMGIK